MKKSLLWALLIIALAAIVMILTSLTRSTAELDLYFASTDMHTALVILISMTVGVVVGLLLK